MVFFNLFVLTKCPKPSFNTFLTQKYAPKGSSTNTSIPSVSAGAKKRVRFCISRYSYIEPAHHSNPNEEPTDLSPLFYSASDLGKLLGEERSIIAQVFRNGYSPANDNSCFRGLEDFMPGATQERVWTQLMSREAVFKEQRRQRELSITDPKTISRIYTELSRGSKERAEKVGIQDAQVAYQIFCGQP